LFMEIQKKKIEIEVRKLAIKKACEEQKNLYVKAYDLYPNAAKFIHDLCDNMYARFAQKEGEAENRGIWCGHLGHLLLVRWTYKLIEEHWCFCYQLHFFATV